MVSAWRAAAVSAVLIALLFGWSRIVQPQARLHGTPLEPRPAPSFAGFVTPQGKAFHWQGLRGKAVLVFFGYTHCPDVCPMTLAALARALAGLGPMRRDVTVVFVTLDPQRDTPAVLQGYVDAFFPGIVGLRGSPAAVRAAARSWGVTWRRVAARDGSYWIDHTAAVTLIGPGGHLRARYGYGQLTDSSWLDADIRVVLARRAGRAAAGAG